MDVLLTFETLPEYVPNVKMKEKSWEEARLPGITLPGYDRPCNKKKYMDEERIKKEQQSSDAKNGNSKRKMGGLKSNHPGQVTRWMGCIAAGRPVFDHLRMH